MSEQKDIEAQIREMYANAMASVDAMTRDIQKAQQQQQAALEAAENIRATAEQEGVALAHQVYEAQMADFKKEAQREMLLEISLKHLLAGAPVAEIAHWLDVDEPFVALIQAAHPETCKLPEGMEPAYLAYTEEGRSGTVIFKSGAVQFDLWWEFAGGDAVVILELPAQQDWAARTALPTGVRMAVMNWLSATILRDKMGTDGYFMVHEQTIEFRHAPKQRI